jgi:hypothetical protein
MNIYLHIILLIFFSLSLSVMLEVKDSLPVIILYLENKTLS